MTPLSSAADRVQTKSEFGTRRDASIRAPTDAAFTEAPYDLSP